MWGDEADGLLNPFGDLREVLGPEGGPGLLQEVIGPLLSGGGRRLGRTHPPGPHPAQACTEILPDERPSRAAIEIQIRIRGLPRHQRGNPNEGIRSGVHELHPAPLRKCFGYRCRRRTADPLLAHLHHDDAEVVDLLRVDAAADLQRLVDQRLGRRLRRRRRAQHILKQSNGLMAGPMATGSLGELIRNAIADKHQPLDAGEGNLREPDIRHLQTAERLGDFVPALVHTRLLIRHQLLIHKELDSGVILRHLLDRPILALKVSAGIADVHDVRDPADLHGERDSRAHLFIHVRAACGLRLLNRLPELLRRPPNRMFECRLNVRSRHPLLEDPVMERVQEGIANNPARERPSAVAAHAVGHAVHLHPADLSGHDRIFLRFPARQVFRARIQTRGDRRLERRHSNRGLRRGPSLGGETLGLISLPGGLGLTSGILFLTPLLSHARFLFGPPHSLSGLFDAGGFFGVGLGDGEVELPLQFL